jgi:hypothetical protein
MNTDACRGLAQPEKNRAAKSERQQSYRQARGFRREVLPPRAKHEHAEHPDPQQREE